MQPVINGNLSPTALQLQTQQVDMGEPFTQLLEAQLKGSTC